MDTYSANLSPREKQTLEGLMENGDLSNYTYVPETGQLTLEFLSGVTLVITPNADSRGVPFLDIE